MIIFNEHVLNSPFIKMLLRRINNQEFIRVIKSPIDFITVYKGIENDHFIMSISDTKNVFDPNVRKIYVETRQGLGPYIRLISPGYNAMRTFDIADKNASRRSNTRSRGSRPKKREMEQMVSKLLSE